MSSPSEVTTALPNCTAVSATKPSITSAVPAPASSLPTGATSFSPNGIRSQLRSVSMSLASTACSTAWPPASRPARPATQVSALTRADPPSSLRTPPGAFSRWQGKAPGRSIVDRAGSGFGLRDLVRWHGLAVGRCRTRRLRRCSRADQGEFLRRVGLLAVHRDVADLQFRIGYPQLHKQPDALEDEEGDQAVPDDHGQGGTRLNQQLVRVPVKQAGRCDVRVLAEPEIHDHLGIGEQADEQPAEEPRDSVCVHDPQCIVHLAEWPHLAQVVPREPDDAGADRADDNGADSIDVTGRRGNTDQATDHAVDAAEEGRLLTRAANHVHDDPGHHRDGGGEVGVAHGRGGIGTGEVRVTAVEPVPAEPQDAGADRDEQQVVGHAAFPVPLEPRPDDRRRDEAGYARRQVNHVAAAEVQCALLRPEAAAPQQERVHRIGEGDPQRYEDQPDLEADPADHAPDEQDRRDRGEHELEIDQGPLREPELRHQPVQQRDIRSRLFTRGPCYRLWLANERADPW